MMENNRISQYNFTHIIIRVLSKTGSSPSFSAWGAWQFLKGIKEKYQNILTINYPSNRDTYNMQNFTMFQKQLDKELMSVYFEKRRDNMFGYLTGEKEQVFIKEPYADPYGMETFLYFTNCITNKFFIDITTKYSISNIMYGAIKRIPDDIISCGIVELFKFHE